MLFTLLACWLKNSSLLLDGGCSQYSLSQFRDADPAQTSQLVALMLGHGAALGPPNWECITCVSFILDDLADQAPYHFQL